jgi:CBS domain-containing protein
VIEEVADTPALRSSGRALRVDEVMGPAVVVHEQTTLRDVACQMLAKQVQSVAVVDDRAKVVGVVTERQLTLSGEYLRLATMEVPEIAGRWVTAREEVDAACIAARTVKAREVMERRLTCACADEAIGAAVERMRRREVEYAVVHRGGVVVGMLGSHGLLRKVAGESTFASQPTDTPPQIDGQAVHIVGVASPGSLFSWLVGSWR